MNKHTTKILRLASRVGDVHERENERSSSISIRGPGESLTRYWATWVLANQNTLRAMHITGEQTREDDGKLVTRITGEQSLWVLQACLCTAGNIGWTLPINVASM